MPIMTALVVGGMAIGGLLGIGKAAQTEIETTEKKRELERKRQYLTREYDTSVDILKGSADRAVSSLEANIADTRFLRDRGAATSGRQIVDQQILNDMQIAQLEVQSAEAQGSAMQSLAMSGTRRMIGTGEDQVGKVVNAGVYATREKAGASLALARKQADIQTRQSLESANYNYTNANMQIRGYQRQIQNTKSELDDRLKQMRVSYENQLNEIDYERGYMDSGEFKFLKTSSQLMDIFGGALSGGKAGFSLFNSGNQYGLWDEE